MCCFPSIILPPKKPQTFPKESFFMNSNSSVPSRTSNLLQKSYKYLKFKVFFLLMVEYIVEPLAKSFPFVVLFWLCVKQPPHNSHEANTSSSVPSDQGNSCICHDGQWSSQTFDTQTPHRFQRISYFNANREMNPVPSQDDLTGHCCERETVSQSITQQWVPSVWLKIWICKSLKS